MKKFGFTLAEVLITLGVIGIITATTIPTFVANAQNKANAAKLSATITTLETAFSNMMTDEGTSDIYEIINYENNGGIDKLVNFLKITMKKDENTDIVEIITEEAYPGLKKENYFAKTIDGDKLIGSEFIGHVMAAFITKNSNNIYIMDDKSVVIDTSKGNPNILGRDIFIFYLNEDGKLYPYGSKYLANMSDEYEYWKESSDKYFACNDTKKGAGCTARLVENNFVVDY